MKREHVLAAVTLLLTLALGIQLYGDVLSRREYQFAGDASDGSFELPPDPYAELRKQLKEAAEQQTSVQIQINAEPEADARTGRCNLLIGNPPENTVNLSVILRLDESQTVLYRSPVLEPGERMAYVKLEPSEADAELQAGKYSATAEFTVLNADSGKAIGAVEAGVTITVK